MSLKSLLSEEAISNFSKTLNLFELVSFNEKVDFLLEKWVIGQVDRSG